jgi:hypothetical protein
MVADGLLSQKRTKPKHIVAKVNFLKTNLYQKFKNSKYAVGCKGCKSFARRRQQIHFFKFEYQARLGLKRKCIFPFSRKCENHAKIG